MLSHPRVQGLQALNDARSRPFRARSEQVAAHKAIASTELRRAAQDQCCQSPTHPHAVSSSSAAIESALVSPTVRPSSASPLKTISVLCIRALKALTMSFWLSKSTSNTTKSLNLGWFVNRLIIGFCALHVGHQEAVM